MILIHHTPCVSDRDWLDDGAGTRTVGPPSDLQEGDQGDFIIAVAEIVGQTDIFGKEKKRKKSLVDLPQSQPTRL